MAREDRAIQEIRFENYYKPRLQIEWSGSNPIYIGKAKAGTADDEPFWQIQKLTWSGSNMTKRAWADSVTTYKKVWDDRATYTYS